MSASFFTLYVLLPDRTIARFPLNDRKEAAPIKASLPETPIDSWIHGGSSGGEPPVWAWSVLNTKGPASRHKLPAEPKENAIRAALGVLALAALYKGEPKEKGKGEKDCSPGQALAYLEKALGVKAVQTV